MRLPNVTFVPLEDDDAISKIYIARRSDEKASPAAKRLVHSATDTAGEISLLSR